MSVYALLRERVCVSLSLCTEADNRGRSSTKLLDHAEDAKLFHC